MFHLNWLAPAITRLRLSGFLSSDMATDYLLNLKDADVMQMVYEQDVDLGFNWQHINDPEKLKEKIQSEANKILGNSNDFFIDGETGEQVPVSGKKPVFPMNGVRSNRLTNGQRFNFNERFDFIDAVSNNTQPNETFEQNNSVWQNNNQQYSELTSLNNCQEERNSIANSTPALSLTNLNQSFANTQITSPCSTVENRSLNPGNAFNQANFASSFAPSTAYNGNGSHPYTTPPRYSSDAYSPSVDAPTNMFTSMIPSEEGSPMNGSCSTLASPENPETSFRFDQFNNYNKYNDRVNLLPPSSLDGRNPSMTSLPEPGQSFFDLGSKSEFSTYQPDYVPGSTTTTFSQNINAPFLNPPITNYPPPPLRSSPTYPVFYVDKTPADQQLSEPTPKNRMCENNCGMRTDRNPKGYSYLNTITSEEYISSNRDASVFHMQDVKPFHHMNNLSNISNGMRKLSKKKLNQSAHSRESRDEKRARELSLPFTLEEIILTPVEDYNEMLARTHLNAAQQALVKDIRRRGKNKVAAQNCRKRKIETISNMEEDVDMLRSQRQHLIDEQKQLEMRQHSLTMQYNSLYQQVFNSFRDESGRPYDPTQYTLDQVDGSIVIVPQLTHGRPTHEQLMGSLTRLGQPMEFEIKVEHSL